MQSDKLQEIKYAIEFDKRCEELFNYDSVQNTYRKVLRDLAQQVIDKELVNKVDEKEVEKILLSRGSVHNGVTYEYWAKGISHAIAEYINKGVK